MTEIEEQKSTPMKNIPHQFNKIPKFEAALKVFEQLSQAGRDLNDDSIVGEALARAGVYNFRNPGNLTIERLLVAERIKPKQSRGSETCAREMRHWFKLVNFVEVGDQGALGLTRTAKALLANSDAGSRERADVVWRQALLGLELSDAHGVSHPYQILLRLLATNPDMPKYAAGLCLEAKDDSEAEFRRILALTRGTRVQERIRHLAGRYAADNAVKILLPLAIQLGDVTSNLERIRPSTKLLEAIKSVQPKTGAHGQVGALLQRAFVPRGRSAGGRRRKLGGVPRTALINPDLLDERINAHEDCLDRFSDRLSTEVSKYEANYDLLILDQPETNGLLVEAKTLRGDAQLQTRLALGQLKYYDYFSAGPMHPSCAISQLMLTDNPLPDNLGRFMSEHGIGVVWLPNNAAPGGTELGRERAGQFGFDWAG